MGDRLSDDGDHARLARRPSAALRRRLEPLAHRASSKGAIYGALFIGFILIAAFVLRVPGAETVLRRGALLSGPLVGALLFPLGMTVVGSADGTPPFFGRLRAAYHDPRAPVARRSSRALASRSPMRPISPPSTAARGFSRCSRSARSPTAASISPSTPGAWSRGERTQAAELAALRARRRARRHGRAARSDGISTAPSSRSSSPNSGPTPTSIIGSSGRALGDFITYPIFNKYGIDQPRRGRRRGEAVLGRVGRGRHQLVARGAFVLDQLRAARRGAAAQPAADQEPGQPAGGRGPRRAGGARVALGPVDGPDHQLVPAPVAGSRPGTTRTARSASLVAIGADVDARARRTSAASACSCSSACSPTTGCAS